MGKIEEAQKALAAAQENLDKVMKEEKSAVVADIKDKIVAMGITKGDLRGAAMKQLLGKDYEKVYPQKK